MKTVANFFFGAFCIFIALIVLGLLKATLYIFSSFWTLMAIAGIAVFVGAVIKDLVSGK